MTKETWDTIITTAAIAIISYTIGYFVGGGVRTPPNTPMRAQSLKLLMT